jgi:purine nucleosidase
MTVADFRAPAPEDCHTSVAVDLDHGKFWDLVIDAIERIGEPTHDGGASADALVTETAEAVLAGEAK